MNNEMSLGADLRALAKTLRPHQAELLTRAADRLEALQIAGDRRPAPAQGTAARQLGGLRIGIAHGSVRVSLEAREGGQPSDSLNMEEAPPVIDWHRAESLQGDSGRAAEDDSAGGETVLGRC